MLNQWLDKRAERERDLVSTTREETVTCVTHHYLDGDVICNSVDIPVTLLVYNWDAVSKLLEGCVESD